MDVLTLQEAADFLRVSPKTIRRMAADPNCPLQRHTLAGRRGTRYLRSELLLCLERAA